MKRVRALMARATDPGATEEEQRTSAHIAAKLCREHKLELGALRDEHEDAGGAPVQRARAEVVIGGVRTVIETVQRAKPGLDSVLGFDVFAFAQELFRERVKESLTQTIRAPAPKRRARKRKPKRPPTEKKP